MVISFSIKKFDKEHTDLVADIKGICIRNGINFSHVVLEALAKHKKEVLDANENLR